MMLCSLVHNETEIPLYALVNVLLHLTNVWSFGSICSMGVSFETIRVKHAQLCEWMGIQRCENLSDVNVPNLSSFLPPQDTYSSIGKGMRLCVRVEDGVPYIILEDIYE